MCDSGQLCQITEPRTFSTLSRPHFLFKLHRLAWYIRRNGLVWTFRHGIESFAPRVPRLAGSRTSRARTDEVLGLNPGDWVEVKSWDEIAETLDANGKNRGLTFLSDMRPFCGRRFPVYKRLRKVFLEESKHNRSMKNTVLLSGAVCDGKGYGCDRSCLYYWREVWLRRVDAPPLASVERG